MIRDHHEPDSLLADAPVASRGKSLPFAETAEPSRLLLCSSVQSGSISPLGLQSRAAAPIRLGPTFARAAARTPRTRCAGLDAKKATPPRRAESGPRAGAPLALTSWSPPRECQLDDAARMRNLSGSRSQNATPAAAWLARRRGAYLAVAGQQLEAGSEHELDSDRRRSRAYRPRGFIFPTG